jgi:outer membrane receptor protein involved in Fe transport
MISLKYPVRPQAWAILVLLGGALYHGAAQDDNVEDVAHLKGLPLEEILKVQIWTASRKEETAIQTAAAVTVITQEDIRRSGVTSIPEALRLSPGIHVARMSSHEWAISSRGLLSSVGNKLQVLIDGRSVYSPLFSGVFWDVQDVLLEDVDRIEVIRGPGATLWGANAVNGVLNVMTKDAKATQGTLITAGGGTEERAFAALRYGGKISDDAHYRVYAKGFDRDSFALPNGESAWDDWQKAQGGFRSDWDVTDETRLTLQGDVYAGRIRDTRVVLDPTPPFIRLEHPKTDVKGGNMLGRWQREISNESDLQVQAYYDYSRRDIPETFGEDRHTFDLDFQHRFPCAERHDVVWGVGYDVTTDEVENTYTIFWEPTSRTINVFSGFIQDEITVVEDKLRLTLGTKLEWNDYSGFEYQPSARFALGELEDDVSDEPVADHDVDDALEQVAPLDVADEVDQRLVAHQLARLLDDRRALGAFLADRQQPDPRVGHAADRAGVGAGHDRVLLEVAGLGGDVGPDVADHHRAVEGRDDDGDARAAHAGQRAHAQLGGGDAGAGVAGGNDHVGLALGGELHHDADRAVRLRADRLDRGVVHRDHLGGVDDLVQRLLVRRQARRLQRLAADLFVTHEENGVARIQKRGGVPAALEDG